MTAEDTGVQRGAHTPGPWDYTENEADARLIAAAPDLLAAAEAVRSD